MRIISILMLLVMGCGVQSPSGGGGGSGRQEATQPVSRQPRPAPATNMDILRDACWFGTDGEILALVEATDANWLSGYTFQDQLDENAAICAPEPLFWDCVDCMDLAAVFVHYEVH